MFENILLVSLNNPREYFYTRHNIGALWLKYFCLNNSIYLLKNDEMLFYHGNVTFHGKKLYILEPNAYMNCNGSVLINYIAFVNVSFDKIFLIHDDLDLGLGVMKLCYSSSSAGHNGVKSVINDFNLNNFYRLRIGLGRCKRTSINNYILSMFGKNEFELLLKSFKRSMFYIDDILNFSWSSVSMYLNNI